MLRKRLLLALPLVLGLAWLVRTGHCERRCGAALAEAEGLFAAGQALGALRALDAADAACDCARFTGGDAPPEFSLAIACGRRLQEGGQNVELSALLSAAKGPILGMLREHPEAISAGQN